MLIRLPFFRRPRRSSSRRHAAPSVVTSRLERLEDRTLLAAFTVSATYDSIDANPGNGIAADSLGATTLRAAIQEANALAGPDLIILPAGTYTLSRTGANEDSGSTGDLDITSEITIVGAGASRTFIDGADIDRILHVLGTGALSLSGVTIRNGTALNAAGILNSGRLQILDSIIENNVATGAGNSVGGGIGNAQGILEMTRVTIRGNSATVNGGGLYNSGGTITMTDCIVENNAATVDGGGLSIFNGSLNMTGGFIRNNSAAVDGGGLSTENAVVTLTDVSVTGNIAAGDGGGLNSIGLAQLRVFNSLISGNTATNGYGGGIRNFNATFGLRDSTVSGNQTGRSGGGFDNDTGLAEIVNSLFQGNAAVEAGGAINNYFSTLGISNSTISGNQAGTFGGGINNLQSGNLTAVNLTVTANSSTSAGGGISNAAVFNIVNSLIAGNAGPAGSRDVVGAFSSMGSNLVARVNGATGFTVVGDLTGTEASPLNPLLGPLADNGGPTLTHALLAGSPAIDAGRSDGVAPFDQTGTTRVLDGNRDGTFAADIGAVEFFLNPVTFVVNSTADTLDRNPGNGLAVDRNGEITLRSAIQEANALAGENRIELPAGLFKLKRAGAGEDFAATGDLDIRDHLIIAGAGAGVTIIDAADLDRVFHILSGVAFTLTGVTIRNGTALFGGALLSTGGIVTLQDVVVEGSVATGNTSNSAGGGIAAEQGQLNLINVTVTGNSAAVDGGGLYMINGTLAIVNSTISGNTATRTGGGVAFEQTSAQITDSTITGNISGDEGGGLAAGSNSLASILTTSINGNTATGFGGGLYVISSQVTLTESTIAGNTSSSSGGGINNEQGNVQLVRSTVSGNTAVNGGGIDNFQGIVGLTQSTVSGNAATANGGGIVSFAGSTTDLVSTTIANNSADGFGGGIWTEGLVRVRNSIIAINTAGLGSPDYAGSALSQGTNIVGIRAGMSGIVNGQNGDRTGTLAAPLDPVLSPLSDHGGPTLTHIPLAGSPAIDAGIELPGTTVDQRGNARFRDGNLDGVYRSDIGATEYVGIIATLTTSGTITIIRSGDEVVVSRQFTGSLTSTILFAVPIDVIDQIAIGGSTSADTVIVDVSSGNPIPRGGLAVRDTTISDGDTVQLTGSLASVTYDFVFGRTLLGDRPVVISGMETVSDQLSATVRILQFTSGDDVIRLEDNGTANDGRMRVVISNTTTVEFPVPVSTLIVNLGAGNDELLVSGVDAAFTQTVLALGGSGDDLINASTLLRPISMEGGDGDDTLIGGSGNDVLSGEAGADSLTGNAGDDTLLGGSEADVLSGGAGHDLLSGHSGPDTLTGGLGNDTIQGGTAVDMLVESADVNFTLSDTALTGLGNDELEAVERVRLTGGVSDNHLDASGFSGRTTLDGGAGNDTLTGGSGADLLTDLAGGNDLLNGGAGNDTLNGGPGSDSLTGGPGSDLLSGGLGRDFIIEQGNVNFTLTSSQLSGLGLDQLISIEAAVLTGGNGANGLNASAFIGMVTLDGGAGNDTLIGSSGADILRGGDGQDSLRGGGGNDQLFGDAGHDTLVGDDGDDTLDGGDGNDGLSGRAGNDSVRGQQGADTILGDAGDDTLMGEGGDDTVIGGDGNDIISGNSGTDRLVGGRGGGQPRQAGDIINATAGEIDESFSFFADWATL